MKPQIGGIRWQFLLREVSQQQVDNPDTIASQPTTRGGWSGPVRTRWVTVRKAEGDRNTLGVTIVTGVLRSSPAPTDHQR